MKHIRLKEHIRHASGKPKTVCMTACLTALGVPVENFHYTGSIGNSKHEAILRRHGYAVRSRKSKLPKTATMGKVREAIKNRMSDPIGTFYFVILWSDSYCHAILLDDDGNTVVDTDPRKRDKRKVHTIHAIFPKNHGEIEDAVDRAYEKIMKGKMI